MTSEVFYTELNKILEKQKNKDDHCILSFMNRDDRDLICCENDYLCNLCSYHRKLKIESVKIICEKE